MGTVLTRPDYGLSRLFGTTGAGPRFFFHADQVPGANASTAMTVPCLGIAPNASQTAAPTISATGWTGSKRCLNFASGKYLQIDALAADFASFAADFVMIAAINQPDSAAYRTQIQYQRASGNGYLEWYSDNATDRTSLYQQNAAGTSTNPMAPAAISQGVSSIIAFARSASVYSVFQLTSGGETRLANGTAAALTGAVSFATGTIGYASTSGPSQMTCRAMGVWHRAAWDATRLSAALVHFRDRLDCPV